MSKKRIVQNRKPVPPCGNKFVSGRPPETIREARSPLGISHSVAKAVRHDPPEPGAALIATGSVKS